LLKVIRGQIRQLSPPALASSDRASANESILVNTSAQSQQAVLDATNSPVEFCLRLAAAWARIEPERFGNFKSTLHIAFVVIYGIVQ
jgi:hypothetical protein